MRHIISILSENQNGALSRIVGLFSQRGYNIENITAAPTEDPSLSRITILTKSDENDVDIEHISKQIHKLINVVKVSILDENEDGAVEREILFVKVQAMTRQVREEIKSLCDIFGAQIVDVTPELYIVQYVNSSAEIDRFLEVITRQADVIETVRSGVCGIARGDHALHI